MPEATLWSAVLSRAIFDLDIPEERIGAKTWILSTKSDLGSFHFVADMLDQNPEKLRQKIFQSDRQKLHALRSAA